MNKKKPFLSDRVLDFIFKNKHLHRLIAIVTSISTWVSFVFKVWDITQTTPSLILYPVLFLVTIAGGWAVLSYIEDWKEFRNNKKSFKK